MGTFTIQILALAQNAYKSFLKLCSNRGANKKELGIVILLSRYTGIGYFGTSTPVAGLPDLPVYSTTGNEPFAEVLPPPWQVVTLPTTKEIYQELID